MRSQRCAANLVKPACWSYLPDLHRPVRLLRMQSSRLAGTTGTTPHIQPAQKLLAALYNVLLFFFLGRGAEVASAPLAAPSPPSFFLFAFLTILGLVLLLTSTIAAAGNTSGDMQ